MREGVRDSNIVSIANFVVVSSVGIIKAGCTYLTADKTRHC